MIKLTKKELEVIEDYINSPYPSLALQNALKKVVQIIGLSNAVHVNQHGYCHNCGTNFDGDLIIDYPLSMGKTMEEALEYCKKYAGWEQYGTLNRWDRKIGQYDISKDRTVAYRCPGCNTDIKM